MSAASWSTVIRSALDLTPASDCQATGRELPAGLDSRHSSEAVRELLAHAGDVIPPARKSALLGALRQTWTESGRGADLDAGSSQPAEAAAPADLLHALAAGEPRAYDELFGSYADRLLRYVRRYVLSTEAAEDVVQDLFLSVWDRRRELNQVRDLESYLYNAARNRALSHLRRRRVEAQWREREGKAAEAEPMNSPDPMQPMAAAEMAAALQRAIDALPGRQREVMLRFWRGERNVEIAVALGISPKTIGVHLDRALRKLRELVPRFLL